MTLPNFLVIGAPKAGTTSLFEYFRVHPQIFMPRIKETRFFCCEGGEERLKFPVQTRAEYEALFEGVTTEIAIGEATPHYLLHKGAARRIRDAIPKARLIASLRDPVDRAYSVYQMNQRNEGANLGRSFVKAMQADHNLREAYHPHLRRFFDLFPRERIKIILLEDLEAEPQRTVRGLFGFLGVDPEFTPDLTRIANPGGAPRNRLLHAVLANKKLVALARKRLPDRMITPFKALRNRNLEKSPLPAAERRAATAFFRDDILRTGDLIGRDLSGWLST